MILSELLVLPIPIQSHHNIRWLDTSLPPHSGSSQPGWDLWTPAQRPTGQILRTCRQLHDEGARTLYQRNTFAATLLIGIKLSADTTVRFLNHPSLTAAYARYPNLKLATKFAVSIHFDSDVLHHSWTRPLDPAAALAEQMRRLLPPRLDELSIHFRWSEADPDPDLPLHLPKYLFYHLRFLRAESFAVTGVSDGGAGLFTRVIASRLPVVDLGEGYRRLGVACRTVELMPRWMESQDALWTAVLEFDVDAFRRIKESLLAGSGREVVVDGIEC